MKREEARNLSRFMSIPSPNEDSCVKMSEAESSSFQLGCYSRMFDSIRVFVTNATACLSAVKVSFKVAHNEEISQRYHLRFKVVPLGIKET